MFPGGEREKGQDAGIDNNRIQEDYGWSSRQREKDLGELVDQQFRITTNWSRVLY